MDLQKIEIELKKRLEYPYKWGQKQTNKSDSQTNFIYKIPTFDELLKKISTFSNTEKNYALNRWLNFWSAMAVEQIFAEHNNVVANKNKYDKFVDFSINNIPFDHKTTVLPKKFNKRDVKQLSFKKELIKWLYLNQSQQGRKHLKNRLFIVLYDNINFEHWKLKAEIAVLKRYIDSYVNTFSSKKLLRLKHKNSVILADFIIVKTEE